MRTAEAKKHLRNGHDLNTDWLKIKNSVSDTATDFKKIAESMLHQSARNIKDQSRKFHHQVGTYTTKKPIKSLGVALLTGIAIGFWLRR